MQVVAAQVEVATVIQFALSLGLGLTITDDGIGRYRAAELKSKSATRHKSFGMKVTSERIQLINQLYQSHTRVQVHDLADQQGKAAGTEVVITIPI
ncbi:hypothetical protein IC229_32310 [Spirosoma sp. BT702]|uniref:Histidine kinase n=1 Tax=Spirosoma profusum TaxID=2771354 RepID=A0A927AVU7_9BACT|nr:hypothetical protein [Spirosoma profusum]MBD2705344.1 hypothetical protein [Spirosoma profusum]